MPIPQNSKAKFIELSMPVVLIDKNFDPPHAIARFRLKSQATNFLKLLQQQDHANLFRYGLTSPAPSQAEPEQ